MAATDALINTMRAFPGAPVPLDYSTYFQPIRNVATAQDAWLKAYENAQTAQARINNANWGYNNQQRMGDLNYDLARQTAASNIAGANARNNQIAQQYQLQNDAANFLANNAVDETGRVRTPEEMFNIAQQSGQNPYLVAQQLQAYQNYANQQAANLAQFNPALASQYRTSAGLSDYYVNNNGQLQNVTGAETASPAYPAQMVVPFAQGASAQPQTQSPSIQLQQMREEAQSRQDITKALRDVLTQSASVDEETGEATGLSRDKFAQQMRNIYLLYPNQKAQLDQFVKDVVTRNGWR